MLIFTNWETEAKRLNSMPKVIEPVAVMVRMFRKGCLL